MQRAANLKAKFNLRLLQKAATSVSAHNSAATTTINAASTGEEKSDDETPSDTFTREFMERKIQISDFQRTILAIGSSISSILDPRRHDMIAALGETTGAETLKKLCDGMHNSEEGRNILKDKPRINTTTINLDELKTMPENTLGFQYFKFLDDNVSDVTKFQ
jgi:ubiquinone biosynthesis protein COQ4